MLRNRNVVLALCVIVAILLGALVICERKYPGGGVWLISRLLNRRG